jgi:hypothetical protein
VQNEKWKVKNEIKPKVVKRKEKGERRFEAESTKRRKKGE